MYDNNVFRECGPGWKDLIGPLVDEANRVGGRVDQIKEKYGSLRFYWTPPYSISDSDYDKMEDMINSAQHRSTHTCEMCGKPGECMVSVRGTWLKTLCAEHGNDLGYKARK